jgi:hypothetical protein
VSQDPVVTMGSPLPTPLQHPLILAKKIRHSLMCSLGLIGPMGTSPVIPVNPSKWLVLHLSIYMLSSLLVPSNPDRLGTPIYIVTMKIS